MPLNLWSLPDEPFPTRAPKIAELIKLAIWGSPGQSLSLQEIFAAIEERYPSYKQAADTPWQVRRSVPSHRGTPRTTHLILR